MGKKAMIKQQAASLKISKQKDHSKHQQFNSLIKVLRPKVYITDSSAFKKLVQELTGNNNKNGTSSSISTTPPPPSLDPKVDHRQVQLSVEPSVSFSTEAPISTSSSGLFCNYYDPQLMMNVEEQDYFDQFCNIDHQQITCLQELDDAVFGDDLVNNIVTTSSTQQPNIDALACDHQINYVDQSLLFDEQLVEEATTFYAQDLSIYDYDFSGLI